MMTTRLDHTFNTQLNLVQEFGDKIDSLDVNMQKICWMIKTLYHLHKQDQKKINELTQRLLEEEE